MSCRSWLASFIDTSAGADRGRPGYGRGAVWMHDLAADRLTCIFASTDVEIANNPDNITVSPRGGLLLCEDGGGVQDAYGFGERLLGLTSAGKAHIFAKNNVVFDGVQAAAAGKRVSGGDHSHWSPWARGSL